jgi:hypothetical protein
MTKARASVAVGTFVSLSWAYLISELEVATDFHREDIEFWLDSLVQQTYTLLVLTQPYRRVARRYLVSCEQR